MGDIVCDLRAEQPDMPSLHRMHQLIAESPRAQVQFFKVMDNIADIHFMGINGSSIGRHHVPLLFNHTRQEDTLACTCVPSLGGFGIAELEPFESQTRGFEHGHQSTRSQPHVSRTSRDYSEKRIKQCCTACCSSSEMR